MRRALLLTALLASCGSCKKNTPDEAKPTQIILGLTKEPGTIDPAFARSAPAAELGRLSFLQLTELDEQWRVVPRLALEVPKATTSTSGFSVRWKLRDGYRWSDGIAVTSKDLAFGQTIEANDELEAVSHDVAKDVTRIETPSRTEAIVHWRQRYADFYAPEVHAVLPAHAYPSPAGVSFAGLGRSKLANGPYVLSEWTAGQHAIFVRNAHFGGVRPSLDRIVVRFFPSEDALEAELVTGGIDAVGEASGLSLDRAKGLESTLAKTHEVVYTDSGLLLQLVVRLDDPVTKDLEVRRAIAEAIDRKVLAELVYGGRAGPASGLFPPRHPGFDAEAPPIRTDVAAAKKRVATIAGPSKLVLQYAGDSQASARAAAYVQSALKGVGFEVELDGAPFNVVYARMQKGEHPALTLFALRMRPDWNGKAALTPGGRLNFAQFDDKNVTEAITEAEETLDPVAWARLMKSVDRRVREKLPLIPLAFRQAVSVRPKDLRGWRPTGTTTPVTWNAEAWRRTD